MFPLHYINRALVDRIIKHRPFLQFSSTQFSPSFMPNSLWAHGLQQARLPCPSPTPGVYSNSCPLSQWCHPTISCFFIPFSSWVQSFLASESFWMSQFFASGRQRIGVSASASVLPMNIQHWFPLGLTSWISLQSGGLSRVLQHHNSTASILRHSAFFIVQFSHPYMTTEKTIALTRRAFVSNVMSLLFNMLSRLTTAFLPRRKHLLISWLQSPSAVILEPKEIVSHFFHFYPFICHEVIGPDAMILVFWMLSFKPAFSLSTFTFIKRLFCSSLSAIRVVSSACQRLLIFLPGILIPACASTSPVFLMMYSAYKLNKQGDNIQPWHTPFLIWNQSVVPCPVLTVASWPAHRFLKRQVRSRIPISFRIFHSLLWSRQSKALV